MRVERLGRFSLRCTVAANPSPSDNTIVQIEWLKDGRKLANQSAQSSSKSPGRLLIERANLLHMAAKSPATSQNQLALGSKLIGSSSLTVSQATQADSGAYSCHFRLVPAPLPAGQQHQVARVTSGQANQSIQVNVIEGE